MKNLKQFLSIILIVNIFLTLNAQEIEHQAPTLQVGLDGISFSKGSLDPEIIARIIAEKQNEIKLKIIQNSFLQNIYGAGGTIYNYADNIIKGVVQEPDTDVRTRKIMESTVNLVFVYAFVDFYLKESHKNKELNDNQTNLEELAKSYGLDKLKDFSKGLKYRALRESNKGLDAALLTNVNYRGLSTLMSEKDENDRLYKFISLLIDMSSEVVRDNDKLRELGLMRISYSSNYDFLNMYKQLENHENFKYVNKEIISEPIYEKANIVRENMATFMKKYTSYIGAIKSLIETKTFKSNDIAVQNLPVSSYITLNSSYPGFNNNLEDVIKDLSNSYKELSEKGTLVRENYLKDLETAISKLTATYTYLNKCKALLSNSAVSNPEKLLLVSDILYTLIKEVIPNIEYSLKFAPDLLTDKATIEALITELHGFLLNDAYKLPLKNISSDPAPFIKLVSKLYEFDKTKTFSEYTTLITLLDEIFEAGKIKNALSTINTFVKDYTVIKEDKNGKEVLEFNVESFLVKLDNIQSDKIRRFQFHFTVGMNTTSFINGSIDIGDDQQISNLSHFSEKIGLKFKIINRGDWLPKNPGESYGSFGYSYVKKSPPKEPLISNWHVLLYGSGILYNVINSSTNKEFNYPMVGFGTGITFYNALDFNVSIGVPLLETGGFEAMTNNAFVGFGFDIQIGEYLKEVGKKRKTKKQNEALLTKK